MKIVNGCLAEHGCREVSHAIDLDADHAPDGAEMVTVTTGWPELAASRSHSRHVSPGIVPHSVSGQTPVQYSWILSELDARFHRVESQVGYLVALVGEGSGRPLGDVVGGLDRSMAMLISSLESQPASAASWKSDERAPRLTEANVRRASRMHESASALTPTPEGTPAASRRSSGHNVHAVFVDTGDDRLPRGQTPPAPVVEFLGRASIHSSSSDATPSASKQSPLERVPRYKVPTEEERRASRHSTSSVEVPAQVEHGPDGSLRVGCDRSSRGSHGVVSERLARNRRNVGHRGVAIWKFLEDPDSSWAAYLYAYAHSVFVLSGVCLLLAMTLTPPPIDRDISAFLDLSFDVLLLVELAVRVVVCPMSHWRFMQDPFNLLDLVSTVLPLSIRIYYGGPIYKTLDDGEIPVQLMFCVVPVLRLMKMLRRFQKYQLLTAAFVLILEALPVLVFSFVIVALVFASMLFLVEHDPAMMDTPDEVNSFPSMAVALWYTVVTMTTVGYGDKIPLTSAGKVIAGCLMIVSAIYMAMPIGIAGNAFQLVWADRDRILLVKRTRDKIREWGYNPEDLPELFRTFDVDCSGDLDLAEFQQMITDMGIGLPNDRIVALFESIDADHSGNIDDAEFIRVLFPDLYHRMQIEEHDALVAGHDGSSERGSSLQGWKTRLSSLTTWSQAN